MISEEFQKIGLCHYTLIKMFGDKYLHESSWQTLLEVYHQQFVEEPTENGVPQIAIKPFQEMSSNDIRGIDDPEATLRNKAGDKHIGYVGNVVETADPDSDLNLIANVTVCSNNTCDENMLVDNFDKIKQEQLPNLEEIHFDGGYGGPGLDEKLEEHKVKGIQTAIKGVKTECRMQVIMENGEYYATCAGGIKVQLIKTKQGYKAIFDKGLCEQCPLCDKCPAKYRKRVDNHVYYFRDKDLGKRLRLTNLSTIPKERRTLRSGVEATMWQIKCKTKAGKTRLRGLRRHTFWLQLVALGINLKRIYNFTKSKNVKSPDNPSGASKHEKERENIIFASIFSIIMFFNQLNDYKSAIRFGFAS